jgi:hypothetical protein
MPDLCDSCAVVSCPNRDGSVVQCPDSEPMIVYTVTTPEEFPAVMDWILSEDD